MASQDLTLTIEDGALGIGPVNTDRIVAKLGCCSAGSPNIPFRTASETDLVAEFGQGPGVEAAALDIAAGAVVIFTKIATNDAGSIVGADATPLAVTGATNASPIVVTTAAHGLATGDMVTISGSLGNTAPNGTWVVTVLSPTTFSLNGSTGNGVWTSGGSVQSIGLSQTGTGTSEITVTGTPYDRYDVKVKVETGGTIGVAGIVISVSLDEGITWNPKVAIGTASVYAIPNSGMTLNFSAGTLVAGDTLSYSTTQPTWVDADVTTAWNALIAQPQEFQFAHVVGPANSTSAENYDALTAAAAVKFRYTSILGEARDVNPGESQATWKASLIADYVDFVSLRTLIASDYGLCRSAISGRWYRRPVSWPASARKVTSSISDDIAEVKEAGAGKLANYRFGDPNDGHVYHDEAVSPALDDARFITQRTWVGFPGVFVHNPRVMAGDGSDFWLWQYRSIMDTACRTVRKALLPKMSSKQRVDPKTGFILEKNAQALDSVGTQSLERDLIAPDHATAATVIFHRDDPILSTPKLRFKVRVTPPGYIKSMEGEIGFNNPALSVTA